jgi:hypothetical protein
MDVSLTILFVFLIAQGAVGLRIQKDTPKLEPSIQNFDAECGSFTYPASGNYEDNEDITFFVSPTGGGAREYVFTKFDTEATYDVVSASILQNGQYVPVGQWSGRNGPTAPIVSPDGGFSLRFTSDSSITASGFSLLWYRPSMPAASELRRAGESSNETIACNSFSTMQYPENGGEYGNNEDVEITLIDEISGPKTIAFTRFDIEANNDWLNIYVWVNGQYQHHKSFTGRTPPASFIAPEGRTMARFTSNGNIVGTGFKALIYNV